MRTRTLRVLGLVAGATLTLGLAMPAAANDIDRDELTEASTVAAATSPHFDVTKIVVKDRVISPTQNSCVEVPVTIAYWKPGSVESWDLTVDITRNSQVVSYAFFDSENNPKQDRFLYCPFDGIGKFTVGPSDWWVDYPHTYKYGLDTTKSSFYVRAQTKAKIMSITRASGYATVKVSATRFDPGYPSQVKFSAPKVALQVKVGTSWKTVTTGELVNGVASLRYKTSKAQTYRVSIGQTDSTTAVITGAKTQ